MPTTWIFHWPQWFLQYLRILQYLNADAVIQFLKMKDLGTVTAASAPGAWGSAASAVPSVFLSSSCSQHLPRPTHLLSGIPSDDGSYWDWKMRSQKWSRNGKATRSPPEPHCHFHKVEIISLFYYTSGKSVQKNQICLFRWKSRAGCSAPLRGVTTCSHHLHWPLCVRSLHVQGWWDTWRWASRSQSNGRSQHRDWRHQYLISEI